MRCTSALFTAGRPGGEHGVWGCLYAHVNNDPERTTNLYLGSWFRLGDAAIPYIGLEYGSLRFGGSYDVNTSSLKPGSNMRGGAEFSIIMFKSQTTRMQRS
jgi:hypothetical protein